MNKTQNWHNIIKSWQNSGEKQTTWCKQNDVNIATFKYWKHKFKRAENHDVQFQKLETKKPKKTENPSPKPITIEIAEAKIEVYDGANPDLLRTIIKVLKSC